MMEKHRVYLSLGSNQGDRQANILMAIQLIGDRVGTVLRQSSLIETEPWGFDSKHKFLNGVILVETMLSPREVLQTTQQIERDLGKRKAHATRRSKTVNNNMPHCQYHDRPIDIDILLYDNLTVDEPGLTIPHPLMRQRDFVMIPLNEIADNEDTSDD
jgi:2-amino-4-hydroxy-6-hydroxymethyldihydropteridine diphosphokinase